MRAAPKVMPPALLCWHMTSEADVGGMTVEAEKYPDNIQSCFVAMQHIIAGGQSDRMASGTEVLIKQKNVTEFLHAETVAPIDISVNIFECLWRSNSQCEHSEVVDTAFLQCNIGSGSPALV